MEIHWQDLAFWELVLDALALLFCGLAAIGLMVWRRERPVPIRFQIPDAALPEPGPFRAAEWAAQPNSEESAAAANRPASPETSPDGGDRYDRAAELAASGLSVSAVAEELGLPRGEVELALKFRRMARPEVESVPAAVIPLRDSRERTRSPKSDGPERTA